MTGRVAPFDCIAYYEVHLVVCAGELGTLYTFKSDLPMSHPFLFSRNSSFRVGFALLLCVSCFVFVSCGIVGSRSEEPQTYRVTEGACGEAVFVESVGSDSTSAFEAVEKREYEEYGQDEVMLEAYSLKVVDEDGTVPEEEFYGIRALNRETGISLHSVSDVITSEGDLYNLRWCPD